MRLAFALVVILVVETLCVLLLILVSKHFATPAALLQVLRPSDLYATRWWTLATAISFVQAVVIVVVVPALRTLRNLSGCVEIQAWKKQVATYEVEQQKKLVRRSDTCEVDAEDDIPDLDSGWRAIKFMTMAVLVYVLSSTGELLSFVL